jgi:hypothetical protein
VPRSGQERSWWGQNADRHIAAERDPASRFTADFFVNLSPVEGRYQFIYQRCPNTEYPPTL